MNKKIKMNYKGKEYILEYNRKSVSELENLGFVATELSDKPATMLPLAFRGAFLKNHKFLNKDLIDEMFEHISDKQKLISTLSEMMAECYTSLMSDGQEDAEGNASWEIVQ